MPRICPNCAVAIPRIRGVEARQPRPAGGSWFRWAPRYYLCRNCGVELRVVSRPARYILVTLMGVIVILHFLALRGAVPRVFSSIPGTVIALLLLAIGDMFWGFALELPTHPSNPTLTAPGYEEVIFADATRAYAQGGEAPCI